VLADEQDGWAQNMTDALEALRTRQAEVDRDGEGAASTAGKGQAAGGASVDGAAADADGEGAGADGVAVEAEAGADGTDGGAAEPAEDPMAEPPIPPADLFERLPDAPATDSAARRVPDAP
jgi:hypothetical protein